MKKTERKRIPYFAPNIEVWSVKKAIGVLHTLSTELGIDPIEDGEDVILQ